MPAAACFRPASHRSRLAPSTHVSLAAQRLHAKADQESDTRCSCHQSEQQQEAAGGGKGAQYGVGAAAGGRGWRQAPAPAGAAVSLYDRGARCWELSARNKPGSATHAHRFIPARGAEPPLFLLRGGITTVT